jgi:hypothetical protein
MGLGQVSDRHHARVVPLDTVAQSGGRAAMRTAAGGTVNG